MSRGWLLLLCATLLLWRPLDFAFELPSTLSSLGHRGFIAIVEILFHGAVAALAVAAARALWDGMPAALLLTRSALVLSAIAACQSLYWSVLPHQTVPSDKPVLAALAVFVTSAWLIYLGRKEIVR